MKMHKNHVDMTALPHYAFPVLDNEFDMDSAPPRFMIDPEHTLLREDMLPDNDNSGEYEYLD